MRSTFISLIFMMCGTGLLYSQSYFSPALVTWGGGSTVISTGQVDWSLGQVAITSVRSGGDFITQGFHQPEFTLVGTENISQYDVLVYPNPTNDLIYVEGQGTSIFQGFEILDMQGRLMASQMADSQNIFSASVQSLLPGFYILRIFIEDDVVNVVFNKI